ncbi:MAG TPA: PIN domain-containing protein [Candidatus Saccharimonadales bacterium]|jgi:predicted nucleic acid-binding protein|nr:PIN domain-containing protein [Candidatus Saccharimonadales bacterium]
MAQPLAALPDGSDLLIDTNIFVYGLTGKSAQCRDLLEKCSTQQVTGMSLFEVLHEATHKFMIAEAAQKGLFTGQLEKGAKYLAKNPGQVKLLSDYWLNTQRLRALNLLFLPMEQDIVARAQVERSTVGMLTNDSIIVAAMREYGLSLIATNDRQFDAVPGITVFSPTDV